MTVTATHPAAPPCATTPTESELVVAGEVLVLDRPSSTTMRRRLAAYRQARLDGLDVATALLRAYVTCECAHDDVELIGHWRRRDPILWTGAYGRKFRCRDCDEVIVTTTHRNY